MNLSFPDDESSVNAAIDKDSYLGESTDLSYPGIDVLVRLIRRKGRGCLLFKKDLWKCYRQIYMDPGSILWLGFVVDNKHYFDVVLSMGLRIVCYIAQRISNALIYLYKRLSFEGINYLDDLGGAEVRRLANRAFQALGQLLDSLWIREAENKACPPATVMIFLGIRCDTVAFTLTVTQDRLIEINDLVKFWQNKELATPREVQSLAGKLNFVCYTVRSGRVFVARILRFLRSFGGQPGRRRVTRDLKLDVAWWGKFLKEFNGVAMFPETRWLPPDAVISTDSCLTGCGGWAQGEYFHACFPDSVLNKNITINKLECLAIVVAVRLWSSKLVNRNLLLFCDNSSSVQIVNHGNARNEFSQACLRELVWITAKNNIWIKFAI